MTGIGDIWVYLSETPLLWLTATLVAYVIADWISERAGRHPLANPVAMAAAALILLLTLTKTSFPTYFEGAQFVHFLLGPATVALGVPLFGNFNKVRQLILPIGVSLAVGVVTAITTAIAIAYLFGAPREILASIAPKSVTTPIAMGISEALGGIPTLTAVLVITTGILGAILVTPVMNLLRVKSYEARGFAVGLAAHGMGTARAFQVNEVAGTFAGIAMGLNGAMTALLTPLIARIVG